MLFRTVARLAAKQIEGEAKGPGFISKVGTRLAGAVKIGTPLYSLGFGAAAGVLLSGFVRLSRVSIPCWWLSL